MTIPNGKTGKKPKDPRTSPASETPVTRGASIGSSTNVETASRPMESGGVMGEELDEAARTTDARERAVKIVAAVLATFGPYTALDVQNRRSVAEGWVAGKFFIADIEGWSVRAGVTNPARASELRSVGLTPDESEKQNVPGGATIGRLYNDGKINIETAQHYAKKSPGRVAVSDGR